MGVGCANKRVDLSMGVGCANKRGDLLMGVGCAFIKNMSIYIRIILLSSFLDKMVLY
jgi:hypothetical protein